MHVRLQSRKLSPEQWTGEAKPPGAFVNSNPGITPRMCDFDNAGGIGMMCGTSADATAAALDQAAAPVALCSSMSENPSPLFPFGGGGAAASTAASQPSSSPAAGFAFGGGGGSSAQPQSPGSPFGGGSVFGGAAGAPAAAQPSSNPFGFGGAAMSQPNEVIASSWSRVLLDQ